MRFWKVFSTSLGLLNLIDLVAGALVMTFAVSLSSETASSSSSNTSTDGQVHLLVVSLLVLGALLLFSSVAGFIGTCSKTFTCLLLLSSYTTVSIAVLELASAMYLALEEESFMDWISAHRDDLNLSEDDVESLRSRTIFGIFFLLACALVECVRFCVLRKVRKQIAEGTAEYREALMEEQNEEASESLRAKLLVEEKYSELRKKYSERYTFDGNGHDGGGAASSSSSKPKGMLDLGEHTDNVPLDLPLIVDL